MEIKVAIIGPHDLVEDVLQVARSFPNLSLIPFGYKNVKETAELARKSSEEADVLLFAGPMPYQIAREHVEAQKPMIFLPHNGTSLYRAFFHWLRDKQCADERLRFSIDILRKEDVMERLDELEIRFEKVHVMDYHTDLETEEIMQFHYGLWQNGEIDAIFTCVNAVHKQLIERGLPCYRIVPSKMLIHDCLSQALLEGKSVQLKDTQLAIVIISLDSLSHNWNTSEYDVQRKKLAVQQILIDFGEEIQALMNWSERDEITFVSTRGVIERTTHNYSHYPLLDQVVNQLNLTASIGIGLGRTANEAESKAREALAKAKASGGRSCFIVIHDGNVVGLSGKEVQFEYSVRSDDPERLQLARKTGLSVGTINKLISYCQNYGSSKVTAAELANAFGITIRSARRILSKLEQCQIAVVVGEEQPMSRGRPRQLFDLLLSAAH
ncbi:transcriptional regulator [Brevibacillus choshinensis]|uniref:transcriptional regulator n=1 Tax=Brevibacillus choshinensis TaxID=54911 RepID=UPI002E1F9CBE|nr:transcriptional regulator [Brevibacillus choshinensis]